MKLKNISIYLSIIFFLLIAVVSFRTQFYKISSNKKLINVYRKELDGIGQSALTSQDLPISAILVYNFEIIGRGHNTIMRDSDAGGHAIINAISDAISHVGMERFNYLSRDSMKIISSYEPCEMCKGAMIEYNIKSIEFLKSKPFAYWLEEQYKDLKYELSKQKLEGDELQDSLFRLLPAKMEVMLNY